ncbi:MAG: RDD family protein [Patescibacteria group bacterium]
METFFHETKQEMNCSISKRIIAYLIDIFIILLFIIGLSLTLIPIAEFSSDLFSILFPLYILIISICAGVYLFIKDGFNGQSIGKKIMNIQVVDIITKQPISYGKSALRMLILRMFGIVELIIAIIQPNHRRLGDYIAKTIVINKDTFNNDIYTTKI